MIMTSPIAEALCRMPINRKFMLPAIIPIIIGRMPRIISGIAVPRIYGPFFKGALHVQYGVSELIMNPKEMSLK